MNWSKLLSQKNIGLGALGLVLGGVTAYLADKETDVHTKSKSALAPGRLVEYGVSGLGTLAGGRWLGMGSALGSKLTGGMIAKHGEPSLPSSWSDWRSEAERWRDSAASHGRDWRDSAASQGRDLRDSAHDWKDSARRHAHDWQASASDFGDEARSRTSRAYDALRGRPTPRDSDIAGTLLLAATVLGLGVGAAYLFDPANGRSRRRTVRRSLKDAGQYVADTGAATVETVKEQLPTGTDDNSEN